MDNFYAFSGGAPAVYLTYARWLAANGIARSKITGKITFSNASMTVSGTNYVGKVTVSTDADLIRIPKSVGTLTETAADLTAATTMPRAAIRSASPPLSESSR